MPEYSASELSDMRMKRLEDEAVERSQQWAKTTRELVFQHGEVRKAQKSDLKQRTTKVNVILP